MKLHLILPTALILASCAGDQLAPDDRMGGFHLSLDDAHLTETRSTPAQIGAPLAQRFHVTATSQNTGRVVYDDKYADFIEARGGKYTITATCGTDLPIAIDRPYYSGTAEAEITDTDLEPKVTLHCTVANALLSVRYCDFDGNESTEVFDYYFSDYGVMVERGSQYVTITGTESAYFRAGSTLTAKFVATLRGNGQAVEFPIAEPIASEAAAHTILNLSVTKADGVGITVERDVKHASIEETLPLEWLPAPKISTPGVIDYVETGSIPTSTELTYITAVPLEDWKLTVNVAGDNHIIEGERTYQLSTLTDVDRQELQALGLKMPEDTKSAETNGSISLAKLISRLQSTGNVTSSTTVSLSVLANTRWSETQTCTINVAAPQITVSVDERNCWTKEFTVDEAVVVTGNEDVIKANLVYQYSADGNIWTTCCDNRRQQFATHPDTKNYHVRALYRGAVASAISSATLETPAQMPNSNMEEWSYQTIYSNIKDYDPYTGNDFWVTNNDYTTRYRQQTFTAAYNCFPAVSCVPGHTGLCAAELRSTASGAGNTWFSSKTHSENARNRVAGELFTGTFTCKSTTSATNYDYSREDGRAFAVRPSGITFYYKYAPYKSDAWMVRIQLMDENRESIVVKDFTSFDAQSSFAKATVTLDFDDATVYAKCKYIFVSFVSTINSGEAMPYYAQTSNYKMYYPAGSTLKSETFKNFTMGSVLTIDDIELLYDK